MLQVPIQRGPELLPATTEDTGPGLIEILRRRWKTVCVTAGTLVMAVFLGLMFIAPRYTATTQILLDPRKQNLLQSEAALAGLPIDTGVVESEVSLMQSITVARRVVERLQLDHDPEFAPSSPYPLFCKLLLQFPASCAPAAEMGLEENLTPAQVQAVRMLRDRITARRIGLTYVVEVGVTALDARKAAKLASAVADAYLQEGLEARLAAASRASAWLTERLASLKTRVEQSEQAVAAYRAQYGLVDTKSGTLDKQQLSELNAQLVLARAQTAEKRAKYDQAERLRASGSSSAFSDVTQSLAISNLRTQEGDAARRLAELSSRYGDKHPEVARAAAELADVRRGINNEVQRIVASFKSDYDVAQKREASLTESLARQTALANKNDSVEIGLRELQREADANRALFDSFLSRSKETREQTTFEASEARVISPPLIPDAPSFPRRGISLEVAVLLGLMAGCGAALLKERLESGFFTLEQIEDQLQLTALAAVPFVEMREQGGKREPQLIAALVRDKPLSRFSEAVRTVRIGFTLSHVDQPPKVIMITSSLPGEGKSTMASALAVSSASSGHRTLLVDCDLRHQVTSRSFKLASKPGVVDLLASDPASWAESVVEVEPNLFVLPAGPKTTNAADLLGSDRMAALVSAARDYFDLVLLDTPPVTAVVDAAVMARLADRIGIVIEWERTPRQVVQRTLAGLASARTKIGGVILNKANIDKMPRYDQYYGYYSDAAAKYSEA